MKKKKKRKIGRIDKADFPKLGLENIPIKIDTGAYTSTIHCQEISEIERDGKPALKFKVLDPSHPNYEAKNFIFYNFHKKVIKSSSGEAQERFIIQTKIVLFAKEMSIKLSLSNRRDMKFPILIGRKLLQKKFIVDVNKTNLSFKKKSKNQITI